MTSAGCFAQQDLTSYSAGGEGRPLPSGLADASAGEAAIESSAGASPGDPGLDAGREGTVEGPDPTQGAALPAVPVGAASSCTGAGEFTDPESSSCYLLGAAAASWSDARAVCRAWGGDLAEIGSAEENALVSGRSDDSLWLGVNDVEVEGSVRTLDGSELEYDAWGPGQPDDYLGAEDCVELRPAAAGWNDIPCADLKLPLCERAQAQ